MSDFIIVHDLSDKPLYIRKSAVTSIGTSTLNTTFVAQNGATEGIQCHELPEDVIKLIEG